MFLPRRLYTIAQYFILFVGCSK